MAEAVHGGRRSAHNERWESAHPLARPPVAARRISLARDARTQWGAPLDGASKSMVARAL